MSAPVSPAVAPVGAVSAASSLEELEAAVKASWAAHCAGQQSKASHYRIVGWAIDARKAAALAAKPKSSGWAAKKAVAK